MNWTQLWMDLFGTTEWMGLNMGFWVSTALVALIVVVMNLAFWNVKVPAAEDDQPEEVVVDSVEYQAIVATYTDKNGKLSYSLLNKDMIQFAHDSSVVAKMLEDGADEKEISRYVAGSKFRTITGNEKLAAEQVKKIIELLDEVSPKGVFKEFNEEVRRWKARK